MQEDRKFRILVVDDEAANRRMAQVQLALLGYASDMVEDGSDAVNALQKQHYDLVLMDLDMPGMDGLSATRAIRAWEQRCQRARVPIIAFSGYMYDIELKNCLDAGMDDGMFKPPNNEEFPEKIAYWLAQPRHVTVDNPSYAHSVK